MKLTLADIAGRLQQVRQYEGYISALCPYHDDTRPSFMVYGDGWFRCLSCGAVGTWDRLWEHLGGRRKRKFKAAPVRWNTPELPDYGTPELEDIVWASHELLLSQHQLGWYLELRGLEDRIEPCKLGWYDGWITIPIMTEDDEFDGVVLRAGRHITQATGQRWDQPHNQGRKMYVPDWHLFRSCKKLAIVFGIFDALALSSLRYGVVTPTCGDQSFDPQWLEGETRPIRIFPDFGAEDDAYKLTEKLGWRSKVVLLPYLDNTKDAADFLEHDKRDELTKLLAKEL